MRSGASDLKWWLSLAVIACITLTGGLASAQNAQGLAAVGAIDPANGYPRWYMDRTGLQLGQCLDPTNPADPCVMGVVEGRQAPPAIPNPGEPHFIPDNFPDKHFYWVTSAHIARPGGQFIGYGLILHTIIGSPIHTNIFRIQGRNVGGPGVNVVETNEFVNVIGKVYVRPATSTVLNSSPNPSVFGQAVTLTATVTPVRPDTIAPTGTVVFKDGATTLGVVTLVNGSASLVTSALAAGAHSLTAAYSGDLEFSASTSAGRIQTVNPGQTTTTLTSTPNPSLAGQAVTLSTPGTAVRPGVGVPTGNVKFRDGAAALGPVKLVNGNASLNVSTLTVGSHSLTAVYNASPNFLGSTSPTVTQVVNSPTTTSLSSTPNPSVIGQAVTLTATVSPVPPAVGTPTGTVTFNDGTTSLGTATPVNGTASLTISTLAVGSHPL